MIFLSISSGNGFYQLMFSWILLCAGRFISPIIGQLSEQYPHVITYKVDIDEVEMIFTVYISESSLYFLELFWCSLSCEETQRTRDVQLSILAYLNLHDYTWVTWSRELGILQKEGSMWHEVLIYFLNFLLYKPYGNTRLKILMSTKMSRLEYYENVVYFS